jgi:sugar (pentulose or hexulose) kinase
MYRALIEGLAYALRSGKEKIEKRTKRPIDYVRVAGGGAQSDAVMQVLADVLNLPTERLSHHEASGLGAAIIGATALGYYRSTSEAAAAMTHVSERFRPHADAAQLYDGLYTTIYKKQYGRLKPLYTALSHFKFRS